VFIRERGVADFSSWPGDKLVIIYADGAGGPAPGPGGWGAVLTYGDYMREIHDFKWGTTDNRMNLLASVRALECLTRPVSVQVWVDNEHVRKGVTQLLSERRTSPWTTDDIELNRNIDLWVRLAVAVKPHEVEWIWADEDTSKPSCKRAVELARQRLEAALKEASSGVDEHHGEFPIERSNTLAYLAGEIAFIKARNPLAVWECIQSITAGGRPLPDPIAEAVISLEDHDGRRFMDNLRAILHDPVLARLVLPSHRRPRRSEVATYRVRIDLRGTKPPVWRRLELASDLFLDDVHQVIQTAFDWTDGHLHIFSSGSSAPTAGTRRPISAHTRLGRAKSVFQNKKCALTRFWSMSETNCTTCTTSVMIGNT
jgi:ribonuclease HI